MAVITNITEYDQYGHLLYRNYSTLTNGNYNVLIYEDVGGSFPAKIAALAGDGDDTLDITSFRDFRGTLSLGAGNDYLNLDAGSDEVRSGIVHGDAGDDTITGYLINELYGDAGNDTLYASGDVFGGDGDDKVESDNAAHGGAGNDTVKTFFDIAYGDAGDDTVTAVYGSAFGGSGDDSVYARYAAAGGDGNDSVTSELEDAYGDAGNDFVTGFWSASGGSGDDTVVALDELEGRASGGSGNDVVSGLLAYGDDGDDIVNGGTLASGGSGNDIVSASGRATLTGGAGDDVFRFSKGQLGFSYATRDKISDFEHGRDKIDLKAFSGAAISVSHEAKYDFVKFDINNDHKTDFLIQVNVVGGGALVMDDLLLM